MTLYFLHFQWCLFQVLPTNPVTIPAVTVKGWRVDPINSSQPFNGAVIWHQPKQCNMNIIRGNPKIYHTFAVFEPPEMGNLMGGKLLFPYPSVYSVSPLPRASWVSTGSSRLVLCWAFAAKDPHTVPVFFQIAVATPMIMIRLFVRAYDCILRKQKMGIIWYHDMINNKYIYIHGYKKNMNKSMYIYTNILHINM